MSNAENIKKLYIMRGLPGAGKTYTANKIAKQENGIIFSQDLFWGKTSKEQNRNKAKAKAENSFYYLMAQNHLKCFRSASDAMQVGKPVIIIDNTNINAKELMPYYKMGLKCGYEIELKEPESEWWQKIRQDLNKKRPRDMLEAAAVLVEKNEHDITRDVILRMLKGWESKPC